MLSCANHAERPMKAACSRCERPLCGDCLKAVAGRPYCAVCATEVENKLAARAAAPAMTAPMVPDTAPAAPAPVAPGAPPSVLRPLAFAIGAGAIGAAVWFGSVALTDYKLGLIAVGLGWLVGFATVTGAGGRGSAGLALMSLGVAVAAMLAGEYLMVNHFVLKAVAEQTPGAELVTFISATPFFEVYRESFSPLDLVFYAIGAYEAWKLPARAGE